MREESLVSCDTFVVMGDVTATGETIFGKNSDRPDGEVQEVVEVPARSYSPGEKLKCTYIEIDQAETSLACILSKPEWMWGAEMGANERGVVIGNEAVWNRLSDSANDLIPRLLGMDLLRLGLERGVTARSALDVITGLLEKYGQGGQCSNIVPDFSYHNSFLIADAQEAWVVETADRLWAAERVETGCRNISNCMSITTGISLCSSDLKSRAKAENWWDGESEFNWCQIIGMATGDLENPDSRFQCGRNLLKQKAIQRKFSVQDMMTVLRDEPSGINRPTGNFPTAGSQVSVLAKDRTATKDCHWLTATANPSRALFKPFLFGSSLPLTELTSSSSADQRADRQHPLWAKQAEAAANRPQLFQEKMSSLESKYTELGLARRQVTANTEENLFNLAVQEEISFY